MSPKTPCEVRRTKAEGRARKHSAPAGGQVGAGLRGKGVWRRTKRGQSWEEHPGEESWRPGKGWLKE